MNEHKGNEYVTRGDPLNLHQEMVLIWSEKERKFVDKTHEVHSIKAVQGLIKVKFSGNDKVYSYNRRNVQYFKNPKVLDARNLLLSIDGVTIPNVALVLDFGDRVRFVHEKDWHETHLKSKVKITTAFHSDAKPNGLFNYLKTLSR